MSSAPNQSAALSEGHYIALSQAEGVQVGYDWFAVRPESGGLLVESRHTIFGAPSIPVQQARFSLDADWTPRRFEVKAENLFSLVIEFADQSSVMFMTDQNGTQRTDVPVGRHKALVLLNGGLYFPLHVVRRFRFDDPRPQQFNIIPNGLMEVRQLDDETRDGQRFHILEAKVAVAGFEDVLRIVVNERGDMVRYQARNQNVVVQLEERRQM
jgi:hypothetical protein